MALTLTPTKDGWEVPGNKVRKSFAIAFTTYTSAGEPLTARQLGMKYLESVQVEPQSYGGVSLVYDYTGSKLRAYVTNATPSSAAVEVTAATDLSWMTQLRLRASGV